MEKRQFGTKLAASMTVVKGSALVVRIFTSRGEHEWQSPEVRSEPGNHWGHLEMSESLSRFLESQRTGAHHVQLNG